MDRSAEWWTSTGNEIENVSETWPQSHKPDWVTLFLEAILPSPMQQKLTNRTAWRHVVQATALPSTCKHVADKLEFKAPKITAGVGELVRLTSEGRSDVKAARFVLVELGLVTVKRTRDPRNPRLNKPNEYRLAWPEADVVGMGRRSDGAPDVPPVRTLAKFLGWTE